MNHSSFSIDYPDKGRGIEGAFTKLLMRLESELPFVYTSLETLPAGKRFSLWFRQGVKRVFYISIIRKSARYVIEMSGGDPVRVLRAVNVCKDHFDDWFGVTADEIKATEYVSQKPEDKGRRSSGD